MKKPILCLDWDGVIHSYTSGWHGADVINDPPVPGAMRFIWDATEHFRVAIFSSRSGQPGGRVAMKDYLAKHFREHWAADRTAADDKLAGIEWPIEKPSAMIAIDDRALTFNGIWPTMAFLKAFEPWNKRSIPDSDGSLLASLGVDASLWAAAFCRIAGTFEIKDRYGKPIDEGWMIGWFANAMMAMHDHLLPDQAPVRLPDGSGFVVADVPALDRTMPGET